MEEIIGRVPITEAEDPLTGVNPGLTGGMFSYHPTRQLTS